MHESHLYVVADAGAGSGAIETLTDALAEHGWTEFQRLEREGGIVESLRGEYFQQRIADARAALVADVVNGQAPLVGATIYQVPIDTASDEPSAGSASASGMLHPIRLEALAEGGSV
jgi:methylmalonyl-CoA mutase